MQPTLSRRPENVHSDLRPIPHGHIQGIALPAVIYRLRITFLPAGLRDLLFTGLPGSQFRRCDNPHDRQSNQRKKMFSRTELHIQTFPIKTMFTTLVAALEKLFQITIMDFKIVETSTLLKQVRGGTSVHKSVELRNQQILNTQTASNLCYYRAILQYWLWLLRNWILQELSCGCAFWVWLF